MQYDIRAAGDTAEIMIYGDIGEDPFADESIEAKGFAEQLSATSASLINVRINSYGGSVSDGIAIYNALRRHPAAVLVDVDGVALSIASLIAMAGDEVRMADNALMMIHAPWGGAVGNARDMRSMADTLDTFAAAMTSAYASRDSIDADQIRAWLTDGEDHWFTASEALDAGLIDTVASGLAVAASIHIPDRYKAAVKTPVTKEVKDMAEEVKAPELDAEKIKAEALQAEASRRQDIRAAFGRFADEHQALMADCLDNPGVTVADARAKLLDAMAAKAEPVGSPVLVEDESDKFRAGAGLAIQARMGLAQIDRGNQFRGASLIDLARASLRDRGRGLTASEIASKVMASHSTSDFPLLLADSANKALQAAYGSFPTTWSMWCSTSSVPDFKANSRIRMGSFSSLAAIPEGQEYTQGTTGEEREQITASTKGRYIQMTRQMLVNDDLGGFQRLASMLGRAAARTVNADVYTTLTANGNMSDGVAIFAAGHSNLASSGGAISVSTLDAGRQAMRKQTDVDGNDYLDIMPQYILVPVALEATARQVLESETDIAKSNSRASNPVRGMVDVISDPYLDANSATAWYLVAGANTAPLMEVAFLDGQQSPTTDEETEFLTDAMRWKVRLDYGVAPIDYRGGYKNAGA